MKIFFNKLFIIAGDIGILLVGVKWIPVIWDKDVLGAILIVFIMSHFILLSIAEYRKIGVK